MIWSILSVVLNLPWLKVAYSALIVSLVTVLLLELGNLWRAQPVLVGAFQYYADGKEDAGRALNLRTQIRHHHKMINHRFLAEAARRQAAGKSVEDVVTQDTAYLPDGTFAFGDGSNAFSELELTVQGVNLSKLTSTLRRAVSDPNEVTGTFSREKDNVDVLVSWPKAPRRSDGALADAQVFPVMGAINDAGVAFEIACSVIWTESASEDGSPLAGVPRADFCSWALAWTDYADIRARVEAGRPLSGADRAALASARSVCDGLIARETDFPEVYRLRAEIVGLLDDATDKQKATAITDLRIYRDLLADKSLSDIRVAAAEAAAPAAAPAPGDAIFDIDSLLAGAERPVLPIKTDRLTNFAPPAPGAPPTGRASLERALGAVGFIRNRLFPNPYSGSGFVVGDDVVATASFVLGGDLGAIAGGSIDFVLADRIGAPEARSFQVTEILAELGEPGAGDTGRIALLRVPGLAAAGVAPIPTAGTEPVTGGPVAVAGFPSAPVVAGAAADAKALMLGRMLARGAADPPETLRYDGATAAGTAGGPILDAATGAALGVHFGGGAAASGVKENFGMALAPVLDPRTAASAGIALP